MNSLFITFPTIQAKQNQIKTPYIHSNNFPISHKNSIVFVKKALGGSHVSKVGDSKGVGQKADEYLQSAGEAVKENAEKAVEVVKQSGNSAGEAVKGNVEKAVEAVKQGGNSAGEAVKEYAEKADGVVKEGGNSAGDLLKKAGDFIKRD